MQKEGLEVVAAIQGMFSDVAGHVFFRKRNVRLRKALQFARRATRWLALFYLKGRASPGRQTCEQALVNRLRERDQAQAEEVLLLAFWIEQLAVR